MPITIRPATEGDLSALLGLFAELHPDDPPAAGAAALDIWREIAAQAGRTILLAELDGAVVGTIDCAVLPNVARGGRPFMLIENVVVAERRRRSGVGSALLDAAVDLGRRAGCYKVQLMSATAREGAHAFYEARGFQTLAKGFRRYFD